MSIRVKDLTKNYGDQKAIDSISFSVSAGSIAGFIGPNGAGKSTTMKIITGYLKADAGKAFVSNLSVDENLMEIRKCIGYLPEHNPLYPEMYVKEYLNYVAGIYKIGKKRASVISDIIEKTGLTQEYKKTIHALSKGYRQRVGLAQALIHDPQVLILDEPTSGLDPNQIIEIRNLISAIGKEKTILLSTHIMQEVEAICDQIIIINKGKIVADDTVENIKKRDASTIMTIVVEFEQKVDLAELNKIEGVAKAAKIHEHSWIIESKENTDIRQNIFQFAVTNNYSVLSMQKKEKNLEQIFQELTQK